MRFSIYLKVMLMLLLATPLMAQTNTHGPLAVIEEEDGDPSTRFMTLKVTNDTLTDNGDGSVSLQTFIPVDGTIYGWSRSPVDSSVYLTYSTDNVGIGTSVPSQKLVVQGADTTSVVANSVAAGIGGIDAYAVSLLHLDNNVTDSTTASSHTWTNTGGVTFTNTAGEYKFGYAGVFSGSGQYLNTPDSTDWTFGSGDWTVEFWAKRTESTGTARYLFGQAAAGGTDLGWNGLFSSNALLVI